MTRAKQICWKKLWAFSNLVHNTLGHSTISRRKARELHAHAENKSFVYTKYFTLGVNNLVVECFFVEKLGGHDNCKLFTLFFPDIFFKLRLNMKKSNIEYKNFNDRKQSSTRGEKNFPEEEKKTVVQ